MPTTLRSVVDASAQVAATRSRDAKTAIVAALLADTAPEDLDVVAHYLAGTLRQRRTGVAWGSLRARRTPAADPTLTVAEVDAAFERLAALAGPGSVDKRRAELDALLGAATEAEQEWLIAVVTGNLRQGASESLLIDAAARAASVEVAEVRRAAMLAGSAAEAVALALTGGVEALRGVGLSVGRPVQPMLAASEKDIATAMAKADPSGAPVAVDVKLDGIRLQAHRDGDRVRLATRTLQDVTERLPEVVEAVLALPVERCVLDGEAMLIGPDNRPRAFQETAARTASDAGEAVAAFFFDALQVDGDVLLDEPAEVRFAALERVVPPALRVGRTVTADPAVAEEFARHALAAGHEGVVVKNLSSPYAAGRRGSGWVKVKPVHTLDLVVLAVERGSGRRAGMLSNIHLGARDPQTGGFVLLGKTFKGMTDEMLRWQTGRFRELETSDDGWVVTLRPEQVVEIAFDGVQRSTRYPGGVALRFARVVRYRDDKQAAEADTIDDVRAFLT